MRVLLVTSSREHCGIHEYGAMLTEAMRKTHPDVELWSVGPDADAAVAFVDSLSGTSAAFDLVHVNHQAALHSSWTVEHLAGIRGVFCPVVVTHHDTFENLKILAERAYSFFLGIADHVVIHEPIEGLLDGDPWTYLRQPVPAAEKPLPRPRETVGSIGFDFPWKNFQKLRDIADRAGWRTCIFGGDKDWVSRREAVARLSGCSATAFLYETGNSGTSAAIRLGLAARMPVIAFKCRQFRDLYEAPVGDAILWAAGDRHVFRILKDLEDPEYWCAAADEVRELAELDSWTNGAEVYYRIYKRVLAEHSA